VQINEIDRQAAEWAAKADGGNLPADQSAALERWLAADARHVGAYAKACAVMVQVERVRATNALAERVMPHPIPVTSRRRLVIGGAIAASLVALTLAVRVAWPYLEQETYTTNFGESRVVALADGSVVTLNTDTKVVVRYSRDRRDAKLVQGEASFDVAKNRARPFVVNVRDIAVRAVGTSFAVRSLVDEPVHVLVREGIVELRRPAMPVVAPVFVKANGHAIAPADAPITVSQETPDRIARSLAWKTGRIAFEDMTLAAASREFARYSNTRIVIEDPGVANHTVTGLFVANDPIGFARAVAVSLDLDATVGQNEVKLMRKKQ
jgi:transmembrane sensor